jgi:lysyl-tRNA synthetase class 2
MPRPVIAAARSIVAALLALAVLVAATGWLYLVYPKVSLPGPLIRDALPLDELSKHSTAPVLLFVGVWAAAALLLGCLARFARAERLTAALLLALAVGVWTYFSNGFSLLIVRQIPAHHALRDASQLRATWIPVVLAALGGALVGRARSSARSRVPFLLAWFVAAAGLIGVVDAILPSHGHHPSLIAALAPDRVRPVTRALAGPLGLALLYAARGLARGRRRSWQLAVGLLGLSTALHLLHRFGLGAAFTGALTVALVALRHEFVRPGDPQVRPRVALRLAAAATIVCGYGIAALWVNRLMADQPFTLRFAVRETARAAAGLSLHGSAHLTGAFGDWFPASVLVLGVAAAAVVLAAWLAPWRYRLSQEARERELAQLLVRAWGTDTLAPFVLRADKSYFFSEDERALLAYRVVGGVAIVSGDPIGPPEEFPALVDRFIAYVRARDWRIAILGVSESWLDLYRERGLHALYHGDEAVIDVSCFSLDGRPIRKVRQSVHRLERAGYRAEVLLPREIDGELRAELEAIARLWRGAEPERGFVMALDALFRLEDEDAVFVVGRGPDGTPRGFLHFAVSPAGKALSLSSMPRLRDTPNGFNEWLVCETVAWAGQHDVERISLNFAPFAALLSPEAELNALQKAERRALLALKGRFQLDNLLLFNRKFFPGWERRFVVYERRRDLPRVGIAALAAEAYLPFTGRKAPA